MRKTIAPPAVESAILPTALSPMDQPPPSSPQSCARLFVGLWPSQGVRDAVRRHADRWTWPQGAALVPDAKLHLTLHFLGAVERDRIDGLLQGLALPFEPFALRLVRGELWPGGIAVLRPAGTPAALQSLHARLHGALQRLGQRSVRPRLTPHVTLARRALGAVPPPAPDDIAWAVDGYALIESSLQPPAGYRVLRRYG
jgi:2'-5' RNA ligase